MFARSIPGKTPHEFEVVIVRLLPEGTLPDGTKVSARFAYPKSSEWGKYGWSIPKRDQAIGWAEMILANLAKPQRERTAWPELFSQFKSGLVNEKSAAGTAIKKDKPSQRSEYPSRRNHNP